jgi:hypothetical protein
MPVFLMYLFRLGFEVLLPFAQCQNAGSSTPLRLLFMIGEVAVGRFCDKCSELASLREISRLAS